MIVERHLSQLSEENKTALAKLVGLLPVRRAVSMYHKAGKLVRGRLREGTLVGLLRNYLGNAAKIMGLVEENNILEGWKPLATAYERESLFDFISCVEETLYLVGKDRLSAALPRPQ